MWNAIDSFPAMFHLLFFQLDKIQIKFERASEQLKFAHTPVRGVLNRNMRSNLDCGLLENATSSTASLNCNMV